MSWYTSGQNDTNVRYFLLDSSHGSYESTRAAIEALSPNYTIDNGSATNTKVVRGYVTDGELTSFPVANAILDRVWNYVNANAAAVSIRTSTWGDKYPVWGQFLTQPQAIPTTGIDRLVQHWKDGLGNAVYIGQDNVGAGSGATRLTRRRIRDFLGTGPTVDPTTFDIVVLCGTLSRFINEGAGSFVQQAVFRFKDGSSGSRTQILSHPDDPAVIMGGSKHGGGGYGEDSDWTDAGGGLWYIDFYGNGNDGTVNIGGNPIEFAHSNAGGARRPLTMVADATECAATADSWFWHSDHGGPDYDRLYCRLADGSNPRTTSFFPSNAFGISLSITERGYFDIYGVTFVTSAFRASQNDHDWAMYACVFSYSVNPYFGCGAASINEGTGSYTYDQNSNINIVGCEAYYVYALRYDTNNGHDKVPLNVTIRDCYIHHTNLKAADAFGNNLHSAPDLHAIATQGCDGHYILNNRFDHCGIQTLVHYLQPANFTTPTGGLELTDYYTIGAPSAACFDAGGGTTTYVGKGKNITIADNLITNPNCTGIYASDEGQVIAFQGDNGQMLGLNSQYANIKILRNRPEGITLGTSIRLTACWPDGDTDYPEIAYNVVRGAATAFSALNTVTTGGATYEPSFYFHHNDVHASEGAVPLFVHLPNVANPSHHEMRLDYNAYRNDGSALWRWASNQDKTTLAAWLADQPAGDTWDPNSTHTAFTADTGSPTLTATVVGDNVVYTLGSDSDGATSDLEYQTFVDGELIEGAESATFDKSAYPGGTQIQGVILGQDAKGKWFLVTSNTVTLGAASDVPISPTGGIPLSEEEYYRKLKKNELPDETVELAPPVPRAVQTGVVTVERPRAAPIRSDSTLKAALERAEQIARERPKKRNRRKDDDWFILN